MENKKKWYYEYVAVGFVPDQSWRGVLWGAGWGGMRCLSARSIFCPDAGPLTLSLTEALTPL